MVRRAKRHAEKDPQWAEDLAQEARCAMNSYLQKVPDAHPSHLMMCIKGAISDHIRRGVSVDTPHYAPHRTRHYPVSSLDAPLLDGGRDGHDVFTSHQFATEHLAIARVLFDQLLTFLTQEESQALHLRLSGFQWEEIGELLYQERRFHVNERGETPVQSLEHGLQKKAGIIWESSGDEEENRTKLRKRQNGFSYYKLTEIPERLRPYLTAQEIEALELYIDGYPQLEVARASGMSQTAVSHLLARVRQVESDPDAALDLKQKRYKHPNRRAAFFALFESLPPGGVIPHAEMMAFFAGTKQPVDALKVAIKRYNRQLTNAQIVEERGGYRLMVLPAAAA